MSDFTTVERYEIEIGTLVVLGSSFMKKKKPHTLVFSFRILLGRGRA
jgi:hypothetical protein